MMFIRFKGTETKIKKANFKRNGGLLLEKRLHSSNNQASKPTHFSSNELIEATKHFTTKLGKGSVFRGTLADGREVAVKRSKIDTKAEQEVNSFINELFVLSQIDHRNIVKLLGCCLETEVPLLVYEFVPNGDLARRLHGEGSSNQDSFSLSWDARLRISVEIAEALSTIHNPGASHFYHRDVKSGNILLDGRYKAKLADFGMSKSVGANQTHVTTTWRGTDGYVDPEYTQSNHYTSKSDVYSFGVVLVELLTGRVGNEKIELRDGSMKSLGTHFMNSMEGNRLGYIVDGRMKKDGSNGAIEAMAKLAERCLNAIGRQRPTMAEVGSELTRIRSLSD